MPALRRIPARRACAVLSLALAPGLVARAATPEAAAAAAPLAFNVRIREAATARAVRLALEGAFVRLGDPACARVLADFDDGSGRPLSEVVASLGHTAQSYLRLMFFYDGSIRPPCRSRGVYAITVVGSRVVLVCGLRFFDAQVRKPFRAEAYVIHELLHSLGLGENPPSSGEITRRVIARCRDSSP